MDCTTSSVLVPTVTVVCVTLEVDTLDISTSVVDFNSSEVVALVVCSDWVVSVWGAALVLEKVAALLVLAMLTISPNSKYIEYPVFRIK